MSAVLDHSYAENSGWSGQLQIKEEPNDEMSIEFSLKAEIRAAIVVRVDHCYCLSAVEPENKYEDWDQVVFKEEPTDEDESCGCAHELNDPGSGQEEPVLASLRGFSSDAQIPTETDVWTDHCYTRPMIKQELESDDGNEIDIKEEPMDEDLNDHSRVLPKLESAVSLATDFAFASYEPARDSSYVHSPLWEHSYASSPRREDEPEWRSVLLPETDPLSLDQESNSEDLNLHGDDPSEDSEERLSAIDDGWQVETKNFEAKKKVTFRLDDESFPGSTDSLPSIQCRICHESFENYTDFDCHFLICHAKSSNGCNFSCHFCSSTFISCQKLMSHLNFAHGCYIKVPELLKRRSTSIPSCSEPPPRVEGKTRNCLACRELFECETDLKIHFLLDECKLACIECKLMFMSNNSLQIHKNNFHSQPRRSSNKKRYECALCKIDFSCPSDMLQHLMARICEQKFACKFCKSPFLTADDLSAHTGSCRPSYERSNSSGAELELSNNSATEILFCHLCGEVFSSDTKLTRHFAVNHIDFHRQHYFNKSSVDMDIFTVDREINEDQPVEMLTGKIKQHTDIKGLRLEIDSKEPEENFACLSCEKTFKCRNLLKCHEEIHKTRVGITCVECERCFALTSNLQMHLARCPVPSFRQGRLSAETLPKRRAQVKRLAIQRTYAKSGFATRKKFTCDSCQKTFFSKSKIISHVKSHVVERNFGCLECQEYFTHVTAFMQHTKHCNVSFVRQNKKSFKLPRVVKKRRSKAKKKKGNKRSAERCK